MNYDVMLFPSDTSWIAFATYSIFPSFKPARLILPSLVRKMEYLDVNSSHMSLDMPEIDITRVTSDMRHHIQLDASANLPNK